MELFRAPARSAAPGEPATTPVPITAQSLLTFMAAASVAKLILEVLKAIGVDPFQSNWVPSTIAVLVGAFIYYVRTHALKTTRDKIFAAGIGSINSASST